MVSSRDMAAEPARLSDIDAPHLDTPPTVCASTMDNIWCWAKRMAIVQMDLSFGARECWRILEAFPPGNCYPSHYYIAEKLGKSKSAVRRYLRELKLGGYIDIAVRYDDENRRRRQSTKHPRGQTSNSYTVLDQQDLIARAQQLVQEWHAKQQKPQG